MRLIFLILLGAILFSNTFSPQYLIWVAPFVAFLSSLEAGLFISASFLTWVYFRYWNDLIQLWPMVTGILVVRNLLLILLLIIGIIKVLKDRNSKLSESDSLKGGE